jgi:hypothetical protein
LYTAVASCRERPPRRGPPPPACSRPARRSWRPLIKGEVYGGAEKQLRITSISPALEKIPQVYTSDGCTWAFVMAGGAALIALFIAVFLKSGRAPLQGGLIGDQ